MTYHFRRAAIAAGVAALTAGPVYAEKVETKGGLKVSSDDGSFSFQLAGRIQFDTYIFDEDVVQSTGGTEFRRTRLTLTGNAYNWDYKFEQDFSAGTTTGGYRDVYIATKGLGGTFMFGQFKPFRAMEELTSANEITMMERPFASATGLFSGRQFQQGVGYKKSDKHYTAGLSVFNTRDAAAVRNEGVGLAARATYAPIHGDDSTVHVGASYSLENANRATPAASAVANYAGRRGPARTIATQGAGDTVDSLGVELAATKGPFYGQAEYALATFGQGVGAADQDVNTYYIMGSWVITGESKPYNTANGVFRSIKPKGASGAWEVTARYDSIENDDVANLAATSTAVGVNFYPNPALRFMLNYTMGEDDTNNDQTNQLALRGQFVF